MSKWPLGASTFIWTSPFSTERFDLIDKVADIGFDIAEVCLEAPAGVDVDRLAERLQRAGIRPTVCGAFGPGRDLSSTDAAVRKQGLAYLSECIDIAARLGAGMVAGPMYAETGKTNLLSPSEKEQQWKWGTDGIRQAADNAAAKNVRLAIEPLNRFETDFINTVDQGMELVERVDRDNVGLLLDTFHMNIEERSIPDAIRRAGSRVFHFHACANDRGTPGSDHIPWPEIAKALSDVRYEGAWVIESFTPDNTEIARAVSLWRPLAASQDDIAVDGRKFLAELVSRK